MDMCSYVLQGTAQLLRHTAAPSVQGGVKVCLLLAAQACGHRGVPRRAECRGFLASSKVTSESGSIPAAVCRVHFVEHGVVLCVRPQPSEYLMPLRGRLPY